MKKRNGFTLIELLAVIVILAVIALIATPMILSVIESSKKGAAENSAYGYLQSIENTNIKNMLEHRPDFLTKGSYSVTDLKGDYKGNGPTKGIISIDEQNRITTAILCINQYYIDYDGKIAKVDDKKTCMDINESGPNLDTTFYENGTIVYFNPETGMSCHDYEEANSNVEVKTGCMKWYSFNDKEGATTLNLLLDHNTTEAVVWNTSYDNSQKTSILEALSRDTATWSKEFNPRIIGANEIAQIVGLSNWDATNLNSKSFYFDSKESTPSLTCTEGNHTNCNYGWLYDRTSNRCMQYGCLHHSNSNYSQYWTNDRVVQNSYSVWFVYEKGMLSTGGADANSVGLRPTITVSKSFLVE